MSDEGGEDGWRPWQVIPWLAGGALSVPVVVGFVMLGAAVLVGRSVREVAREAWTWRPLRRALLLGVEERDSDAA